MRFLSNHSDLILILGVLVEQLLTERDTDHTKSDNEDLLLGEDTGGEDGVHCYGLRKGWERRCEREVKFREFAERVEGTAVVKRVWYMIRSRDRERKRSIGERM